MIRVLMVCLGNICRSPLAEGILRSKVDPKKVFLDSAGTGSWHIGHPPDFRSVRVAAKYEIDISTQRGRQFSTGDFEKFDRIFVMDRDNLSTVLEMAQNQEHRNKVELLLNAAYPGLNREVPDPYHEGADAFEAVFNMLDEACEVLCKNLK
jgi:protein-tyrosine phosphatase